MGNVPVNFGRDTQLRFRMMVTMVLLGLVYGAFIYILLRIGAGVVTTLVVAIGLAAFQIFMSDRLVLVAMQAKVVPAEEAPELHAMIGRLAQAAGVPKPKIAVSELAVPNAFAAGRSQQSAVICVTRGLLKLLNSRELEGVLAHEMTHIKNRDVVVMTYASFFSVVASTLMSFFFWSSLFGGGRRDREGANAMQYAYFVTIVVWLVSQLLVLALSRYREYSADRGAAVITGRPGDLAAALQRLHASMRQVPKEDLRRAQSMNAFFIMPAVGDAVAEAFASHPPFLKRIERLQEMERQLAGR